MQPPEHEVSWLVDAGIDELLVATESTEDDERRAVRGTVGGVVAIPVAFVAVVLLVAWTWPPLSLLVAFTADALSTPTP